MQKPRLKHWLTLLLLLPLSGCMGGVTQYAQYARVFIPHHRSHQASMPSGNGGHYKTGKPYRVAGHTYYPLASARGYDRTGIASWYGPKFHGQKTANGEYFDMHALSAAHRTLPLPSLVRVTNLDNGRQVVVRVNDRGPFVRGRLIDMSYAAAKALGYVKQGTAHVRVQALEGGRPSPMVAKRQPVAPPAPTVPRTVPVRVAAPASSSHTVGMYVQLGAFATRANAAKLKASLRNDYPTVQVNAVERAMRTLYRVRIGPFSNVQDIERTVLALKNNGHEDTVVTIE